MQTKDKKTLKDNQLDSVNGGVGAQQKVDEDYQHKKALRAATARYLEKMSSESNLDTPSADVTSKVNKT